MASKRDWNNRQDVFQALAEARTAGDQENVDKFASRFQELPAPKRDINNPNDVIQALIEAKTLGDNEGANRFQAHLTDLNSVANDPTTSMSTGQRLLAGAGKAFHDVPNGLAQMGARVADPFGLDPGVQAQLAELQQQQSANNAIDRPLMNTTAGLVGNVGGNAALMLAPGGALKAGAALRGVAASPEALSLFAPTTAAGIARQGAVLGAAQPLGQGEGGGQIAANAALGAGGGLLGLGAGKVLSGGVKQGLASLASRFAPSVSPETAALAKAAAQQGITLTAPQVSQGGLLGGLDSLSSAIPLSGSGRVLAQQQGQFNRAVSRTIGEDTSKITPSVYDAAKKRIGGIFNDLAGRNELVPDIDLRNEIDTIIQDANDFGGKEITNGLNELVSRIAKQSSGGSLPGQAYQSIDTKLTGLMKPGGKDSLYYGRLRDALREGMDRSISPQDQQSWMQARDQYKNLKTIRDIVAKNNGSGDINPSELINRVTATEPGKETMAMGSRGTLGDLANVGQRFLSNPPQGVNPVDRLLRYGLLGGGAALHPAAILPASAIAGGAMAGGRATQSLLQSPELLQAVLGSQQGQAALRQVISNSSGLLGQQALLQNRQPNYGQP